MLRGRRLLSPQSPLSGWRTTASNITKITTTTTNAAARPASYSTSQGPDGLGNETSAAAEESQIHAEDERSVKGDDGQFRGDRPHTNNEANIQDSHAPVFRKYTIDDEHKKRLAPQQEPRDQRKGSKDLDHQGSATSGDANKWTESWVKQIGERLGITISKRDPVYFKVPIARRMGLKLKDSRLSSPARVLTAIEHREWLYHNKPVRVAKARQEQLEMKGAKPLTLISKSEYVESRARWKQLKAEGSEPNILEQKRDLKAARLTTSDRVGADLRNSLSDGEVSPAQAGDGKPELVKKEQTQTETSLQRRSSIAGQSEPTPLPFQGERAPTGIRFTVQPTWLPFSKSKSQAEDSTGDRQQSRSAVDDGPIYSSPPEHQSATPEQVNQVSTIKTAESRVASGNIYGMLFPSEMESGVRPSQRQGKAGRKAKSTAKHSSKPGRTSGGIYKKLFPDDAAETSEPQLQSGSQPGEITEDTSVSNEEGLVPPEDSLLVSLRNEVRNWIPEEERQDINAPKPGDPGSYSTVVILSGLSNSLLNTDFYRILPETKHIEGWAGGLVKVVQARDALSHEPLGRYFLMFHSKPAADAYKDELLRLHDLSKRLLHKSMGKGPLAQMPIAPQPFLTDEEKASVRSFTLCPPTAPLQINVRIWNSNLVREIAQNANIADVVQTLRPDVASPSKVLVTVNTIPGSIAGTGGGLTVDELWLTLRDDGRERGAPWVLSNLKQGIMPVKLTSYSKHGKIDFRSEAVQAPLKGAIYDEQDMLAEPGEEEAFSPRKVAYDAWHDRKATKNDMFDRTLVLAPESTSRPAKVEREERFNRFVVTFTQPAISRRFVRSWHKRAIWDEQERRSVSIDAVALM